MTSLVLLMLREYLIDASVITQGALRESNKKLIVQVVVKGLRRMSEWP